MEGQSERERIEAEFKPLRDKLKLIEGKYNPNGDDLHFTHLRNPDDELFEKILILAQSGLELVNKNSEYFNNHDLYDDGMFWYQVLLIVSAASAAYQPQRILSNPLNPTIQDILFILVDLLRYTSRQYKDITKRNVEAIESTIYTFYNNPLIDSLVEKSIAIDTSIGEHNIELILLRITVKIQKIILDLE